MQEIPLTDDEQAAVENDIQAVDKLLNKLTGARPREIRESNKIAQH